MCFRMTEWMNVSTNSPIFTNLACQTQRIHGNNRVRGATRWPPISVALSSRLQVHVTGELSWGFFSLSGALTGSIYILSECKVKIELSPFVALRCMHSLEHSHEAAEPYDREEPALCYRWTGWAWEITNWSSSRLQENYWSFYRRICRIYPNFIEGKPKDVIM
jgi:hypothetical protein